MFCYVNNHRLNAKLPPFLTTENTLFYPEKTMTTYERHTSGVPRDFHIVTDAADLVALYPREEVFIWCVDTKRWINPFIQTYGADIEVIRREFFGIEYSIPRAVIDGKTTNVMGHKVKPELTGLNGVLNDQTLSEEAAQTLNAMKPVAIPKKRSSRMRRA